MKKMLWTMAVVLVAAGMAQASISQSWRFGPTAVSFGATQEGDTAWSHLFIETSQRIEEISIGLIPDWNDPSEFAWMVNVSGRRDQTAAMKQASTSFYADLDGLQFWQNQSLGWSFYDGVLHDTAQSGLSIAPATFGWASGDYSTWDNQIGTKKDPVIEKWWRVDVIFHGSFGDGPAADELGMKLREFAVPEPTTFSLLLLSAPLLRRRR